VAHATVGLGQQQHHCSKVACGMCSSGAEAMTTASQQSDGSGGTSCCHGDSKTSQLRDEKSIWQ